jgi:hypothetical protein
MVAIERGHRYGENVAQRCGQGDAAMRALAVAGTFGYSNPYTPGGGPDLALGTLSKDQVKALMEKNRKTCCT